MANYERRHNQDSDWSDENNFRNRNAGYDRDYNDREFYKQFRGSNFDQDFGDERLGMRRGQPSNPDYDYRPDYASSRNPNYGREWDWDYSNRNYPERGFRAGGNADYYGRNSGSWSGSDYDRSMGWGNQPGFRGRNWGAWGNPDYDRSMGMGRGFGTEGRDWNTNQGSNWGNQGNFQSGSQGQQGEHYGRGPQGYKRSDERIKEDINDRLTWHGNVDATNIQVNVKSGEVTLEGTVSDRYQKRMAEDVAEQVAGVNDVQNRLRVQGESGDMSQQSSSSKRQRTNPMDDDKQQMGQVPNGKPRERSNS